ncbi:Phytochrome B [Hibiscus syriacus]|uniref:Phytochrome B n=1 Tax=Hibiscus syriacus TaxID=106335 RepID=A0A6A2WHT8_HIBSY|nr:Phytochrome B [Hibiscus syriacus]
MVYKFHEDEHGEVLAESKRLDLEPYICLRYPATDIPQASRFLFKQNRVRMIVDCNATLVLAVQDDGLMQPLCLVFEKHVLRTQTLLCEMLLRDFPTGIITQSPNIMDLVKFDGAALYYQDSTGLSTDSLSDAGYLGAAVLGDTFYGMAFAYITKSDLMFWFRDVEARNSKAVVHAQLGEVELQGVDELTSITREMMRLIETAIASMFVVDVEGCINGWNAKIAELTGLLVEEAMRKSLVHDLVYKESQETVDMLLNLALHGEEEKSVGIKLKNFGLEGHKNAIYIWSSTLAPMETHVAWSGTLPWKPQRVASSGNHKKIVGALDCKQKGQYGRSGCRSLFLPADFESGVTAITDSTEMTKDQKQLLEASTACEKQLLKIISDIDLESIEDGSMELEKGKFYLGSIINSVVSQVLADFLLNMVRYAPSDEGWVEDHVHPTLKQNSDGLTKVHTEFRFVCPSEGLPPELVRDMFYSSRWTTKEGLGPRPSRRRCFQRATSQPSPDGPISAADACCLTELSRRASRPTRHSYWDQALGRLELRFGDILGYFGHRQRWSAVVDDAGARLPADGLPLCFREKAEFLLEREDEMEK